MVTSRQGIFALADRTSPKQNQVMHSMSSQASATGFVYIWRDRANGMFYIGSHLGTLDDGYVCGSVRMRRAFKKRPTDFRRKVLQYCYTPATREELHAMEQTWLDMIKDEELNVRYYNNKKTARGGGGRGWKISDSHKAAISAANKGRKQSPETLAKLSAVRRGRVHTPDHRAKNSAAKKGRQLTSSHKAKISAARTGMKFSDAHRLALRSAALKRTPLRPRADNKLGIAGVKQVRGRFRARAYKDGAEIHLGYFDTVEAARAARQASAT